MIAMQTPASEEQRCGRRQNRKRRDCANCAERACNPHETLSQKSKERIRTDVRRENEETLLERRLREPMAHRDEARMRRKILERQRVEKPKYERRLQRQKSETDPRGARAVRRARHGARERGIRRDQRAADRRIRGRGEGGRLHGHSFIPAQKRGEHSAARPSRAGVFRKNTRRNPRRRNA